MKTVEFKEVNVRIAEKQKEYLTLPVYMDTEELGVPVTMCFELEEAELKQVDETGKIWLTVMTFGRPFLPIQMGCLKPDKFEHIDEDKLISCELCGSKFQAENMTSDDDANWFCKKCACELNMAIISEGVENE